MSVIIFFGGFIGVSLVFLIGFFMGVEQGRHEERAKWMEGKEDV